MDAGSKKSYIQKVAFLDSVPLGLASNQNLDFGLREDPAAAKISVNTNPSFKKTLVNLLVTSQRVH